MNNLRPFDQGRDMRQESMDDGPVDQTLKNAYQIWDDDNPTGVTDAIVEVAASLATNLAGINNDLLFTAVTAGEDGNAITIAYVDPGGATATLGVVVTGTDIVVNLGRTTSAIDTTGDLLKAAIAAEAPANALVTVADEAGNDGSGLVTALTATALSGGVTGVARTSSGEYSGSLSAAEGALQSRAPGEYVNQTGQIYNDGRETVDAANKRVFPALQ